MPYSVNPELSKKIFAPKKPKIEKPAIVTMPDPEDPAAVNARKQRELALLSSSGRGSTDLQRGGDYGRQGF